MCTIIPSANAKEMQSLLDLSTDILQPIPTKEWPILMDTLKMNWPTYAYYYYWIKNSMKWKTLEPELSIEIYSINGDYDDGTFIGIASYSIYRIVVFAKESSRSRLQEGILKTNRIDWSRMLDFAGIHEHLWPIIYCSLERLRDSKGITIEEIPGGYYFKSAEDCVNEEVKIPEECYLADLDASHVPFIISVWPHANKIRPEESMQFIDTIIRLNKGIGLFLKENNVLVSWILHFDWDGLGMVQTLDGYRRKGYGKIVCNALAKDLGKQGISPILFVVKGNVPSETMFQSLSWKRINEITFINLKPNVYIKNEI